MKSLGDRGCDATAEGALDKKCKQSIALALRAAVRCDPYIGFQSHSLAKLEAPRREVDEAWALPYTLAPVHC